MYEMLYSLCNNKLCEGIIFLLQKSNLIYLVRFTISDVGYWTIGYKGGFENSQG